MTRLLLQKYTEVGTRTCVASAASEASEASGASEPSRPSCSRIACTQMTPQWIAHSTMTSSLIRPSKLDKLRAYWDTNC